KGSAARMAAEMASGSAVYPDRMESARGRSAYRLSQDRFNHCVAVRRAGAGICFHLRTRTNARLDGCAGGGLPYWRHRYGLRRMDRAPVHEARRQRRAGVGAPIGKMGRIALGRVLLRLFLTLSRERA